MKHLPAPWGLCHHLDSIEKDKACTCGYRGSIWGPDGSAVICEMGSTLIPGEESMSHPRYDRETEIANAHLIAASPRLLAALQDLLKWSAHLPQAANDEIIEARAAIEDAINHQPKEEARPFVFQPSFTQ